MTAAIRNPQSAIRNPQSGRTLSPDDVYLWPDAFWCYREEYSAVGMGRDASYRVISRQSEEWSKF